MKKVLVIGPGGSGKSTLSRKLGEKLGLEVLHLDRFYWGPDWVKTPTDKWLEIVDRLITRDSWIIDGNYSGTLDIRIAACDTIVFLDMSSLVCVWRIIKRRLLYRHGDRPDMAEGCFERFDLEFILWILNYSRRSRPKVVKLIEANSANKKIVWLRSQRDVNAFVEEDITNNPDCMCI